MDTADRKILQKAVQEVRKLLPLQNPLHTFVHNNILMAWEDQPFWQATEKAATLYRAKPYREFEFYTQAYQSGRIGKPAFYQACDSFLRQKDLWIPSQTLSRETQVLASILLRLESGFFSHLARPTQIPNGWLTFLIQKNPQVQQWCQGTVPQINGKKRGPLLAEPMPNSGCYAGLFEISRLIESFMDQGVSPWANPFIEKGFVGYAAAYFASKKWVAFPWQKRLAMELRGAEQLDTEVALHQALSRFHCAKDLWEPLLVEAAFLLKGWAGIINRLETNPSIAPVRSSTVALQELLVVVLFLLHSCHVKLHEPGFLYEKKPISNFHVFSFLLREFIQAYSEFELREWGWTLSFNSLIEAVLRLEPHRLHQIWHEAYEIEIYEKAIALLSAPKVSRVSSKEKQAAHILFCIDDREESLRRHVEKLRPDVYTHGVLGFFGVERGVEEENTTRRGRWPFFYRRKGLVWEFFHSLFLGAFSGIVLVMRVLCPGWSGRLLSRWKKQWPSKSSLVLHHARRKRLNTVYSLEQQADVVASFFRLSSLQNQLHGMVVLMAHGASSANNPFCQSYGCGACGGQPGGEYARLFSKMANNPQVREQLQQRGIILSESVWFIPAQHDTTTDEILFFSEFLVPEKFREQLKVLQQDLYQATQLNAHERIRRFPNAPFFHKRKVALSHVHARSLNLAEPRPEYGHTGVSMAIFGRRSCTEDLFLDRRSFLVTYDATLDLDGSILSDILIAALPVCANINLDYFFSALDNQGFGAGSKLPLNISALLGVVTGGGGDLRIGLAAQMVEKHEPIRCLMVVEAKLEHLEKAIWGSEKLVNLVKNQWVRLLCIDPYTQQMRGYSDAGWTPVQALCDFDFDEDPPSIYTSRFENQPSQKRLHMLRSE